MNRTLELAAMLLAPTLLATAPVVAQDPAQATPVTVEVTGFSPAEGHLMIALFDSAATWSGGTAVEGQRIAVEGPRATSCTFRFPTSTSTKTRFPHRPMVHGIHQRKDLPHKRGARSHT